jgi:hypothetical protein
MRRVEFGSFRDRLLNVAEGVKRHSSRTEYGVKLFGVISFLRNDAEAAALAATKNAISCGSVRR